MTSRSSGGNVVLENHLEKNSSSYRKHRTDVDTNITPSSSRSKSRTLNDKNSSTLPRDETSSKNYSTLPREEITPDKYSHEKPSRIESSSSHKIRSSVPNNDLSQRRTSGHNEDHITDHSCDVSKRHSSRHHEDNISDQANYSPRRRPSRHYDDNVSDRASDSSRRRSSRHYENDSTHHNDDMSRRRSSRHYENNITDPAIDSSQRRSSRHCENNITDQANDSLRRRSSRHYENNITDKANDSLRRRSSRHYDDNLTDHSNDLSLRRSSQHYENDITHHNNDMTRRRSSRHYEPDITDQVVNSARPSARRIADPPAVTNSSSSAQQGKQGRSDSHVCDQRLGHKNENQGVASTRGRTKPFSEHREVRGFINHEHELHHSSHNSNTEHPGPHSNSIPRNSSRRDNASLEGEHPDRRSQSMRRDEGRENYKDLHVTRRSSSQMRIQDFETSSTGHNRSHQSTKDSEPDSMNNRGTGIRNMLDQRDAREEPLIESIKRRSRSNYGPSDDNKEAKLSRSRQEAAERHRNHSHKESSEVRDRYMNNNSGDQYMRSRSSSTTRSDSERYSTQCEPIHSVPHSTLRSTSKQSLTVGETETAYRMAESRNSQEVSISTPRHKSEQGRSYGAQNSRVKSQVMAQRDEITNGIVAPFSAPASDTSREASRQGRAEERARQCRRSSDVRENIESTSTVSRHRESSSQAGNGTHKSSRPTDSLVRPRGSSRRRSVSPYDEQDEVNASSYKQDISLSRRSSSSKSNHDTGFASSSSSPRRDDSQARFPSDLTPSPYAQEECHRSRAEESRHRRRSKMMATNSLDVPGAPLRKEQSLSSSGKGDSSFEEPYTEGIPAVKSNRKRPEEHNKEDSRGSKAGVTASSSRGLKNEQRDIAKTSDIDIKDSQIISKSIGRSSMSITTDNNESLKNVPKTDLNDVSSSTSTLRDSNITSKTSISDSISSLLARSNKYQQFRSSQSDRSSPPVSISDKWRKLKQGILPDKDIMSDTLKERKAAATIFYAAAAKFMSSIPGIQNTFSKSVQSSPVPNANGGYTSHTAQNESATPITKTEDNEMSMTKPEGNVAPEDDSSIHVKSDQVLSSHSIASMNVPSGIDSQRPSIISTTGTLSSHNKRINAYSLMTEKIDTPGSETSGQMTPPSVEGEMKRRSKDMDTELTSFLPAEMSKREEKFHEAARVNDTAAIRSLLKERVNINCRNSLDRTALHWAAANGNLEATEVLIENGADLEAKDKYGMRAVLWAAWFGHVAILKALINAGANTRVTNKQGLGMLHCAAENNHAAVISFIFEALEHYDVNHRDKNERTPLHSAAEGGHVATVNRILEAKADLHKKDKTQDIKVT